MPGAKPSRSVLKVFVVILLAASALLIGCVGSGPSVVIVPAAPGKAEPVRLAQSVKVKIFVPLQDGSETISKNKVTLPAGGYYFYYDPKEEDE